MNHSEHQFRQMIDEIPTLAWSCLSDGEFLNNRWLQYGGLSMEAALGWQWKSVVHPDDLENLMDTWRRHLASGEPGEVVAMKNAFLFLALIFEAALAQNQKYQSQTANLSAVKIHYLNAGTGKKTLVLIHGFGDTSHMWIPLFDEFGKDYTIIAPDMRGLGDSSRPAAFPF